MPRPRPQANPAEQLVTRLKAQAGRRPALRADERLNAPTVGAVVFEATQGAPIAPLPTPAGIVRQMGLSGPAARAFIAACGGTLNNSDAAQVHALASLAVRLGVSPDVAARVMRDVVQALAAHRAAQVGVADTFAPRVGGGRRGGWLYRSAMSEPPPESMREAARRGLEYRRKAGGKGGLSTQEAGRQGIGSGVARATALANGQRVSLRVLRMMRGFFQRHRGNKAIAPEHKGEPWKDRGHVAWLLWGGDTGPAWVERQIARLEGDDVKKGQKVIATGKRGGKIVGYKPDGSPIYGKDEPDTEREAQPEAEPESAAGAPDDADPEPEKPTPKVDDEPLSEDGPPLDGEAVGDPSPGREGDDAGEFDKMHRDLGDAFEKLEAVEKMLSAEMVPAYNQMKADMRAMAERIDKQARQWQGAGASRGARGTRTALDEVLATVAAFVRFVSTVGKRAVQAADRRLKGDKATTRDPLTKAVAAHLRTARLTKGVGAGGSAAWFLGRLVALDAAPVAQLDECEIPPALGRLVKGRTHKYIRRVPKPGGGYRYYYRTSAVTRDVGADLKPGAKFKLEHEGQAGHFEVLGAGAGKVLLRHDESGGEMTVSAAALSDLLRREHAEVVQARRERLKRDIAAAKKYGTAKQVARLEAEAKRHGFDELTADEQRQREDAARASAAKRRGLGGVSAPADRALDANASPGRPAAVQRLLDADMPMLRTQAATPGFNFESFETIFSTVLGRYTDDPHVVGAPGAADYFARVFSPEGFKAEARRIYDDLIGDEAAHPGRTDAEAHPGQTDAEAHPELLEAQAEPAKQMTRAQIENAIAGKTHKDYKSGRGKKRSIMHRGKVLTLSELSADELLDLYADKHGGERVGIKESTSRKRASKPAASAFPPAADAQPIQPHNAINAAPGSFIYQDGQPFMSVDENGRYRDADGKIVAKGRARMTLISARGLTAVQPTPTAQVSPSNSRPAYRIEPGSGPAPYADALGVSVTPEQMPVSVGRMAYYNSSHTPERRGEQIQADYLRQVESVAQRLAQAAKSDEAKAEAAKQLEAYRDGYAKRVKAWLSAKGKTFSWAVTGRGGLTPAKIRSNEKKMETERRRLDELGEWKKKAERRALKAVREVDSPPPPPKPKADDGRVPFFQHRDEANAVTVEDDASADRIRLHFDDKPSAEMIAKLKGRGFRWSRAQGAWQRKRTDNARYAIRALGIDYPMTGGIAKSYRPDAPPADVVKRIRARYPKATAKDIRAWIHAFNSVFEATDGDESAKDAAAFPAAWAALGRRMKKSERMDRLHKALGGVAPRDAHVIVHEALRELAPPPSPNRERHPFVGRIPLPGGLVVNVENVRGSVRRGVDSDGRAWAVQMPAHYGELANTMGADGDPIDVFVGPDLETAPMVFLVALRDAKTGAYDEDKVFLGFRTKADALATYRAAYDRADLALDVRSMGYAEFLAWLERHGHRGRRIDAGRVTRLRKALGVRGPTIPREDRLRAELRRGMVRAVGRLRADTRLDSGTDTRPARAL